MSFRINTNVAALNTYRHLLDTQDSVHKSLERLSTGFRINRAADDPAGYAVTEHMTKMIMGLSQAERNTQDAISFIHVAESGMEIIGEKIQRMRQLGIQCATETYTSADRSKVQYEIDQLVAEIDRIASATQFNELRMLKGMKADIHIGFGEDETIRVTVTSVDVNALGIRNLSLTGTTNTNAENTITSLDAALSIKIRERTELGAYEVRLENISSLLRVMVENQEAARSRIKDVDFAAESMEFTKNQILEQSGLAMLAQANMMPQTVLQLLG